MKVQITIRGRQYTVRSDEEDEDLQAIAQYVDAQMAEVSRGRSMDEYTVAMLAALNIASEFDRFRRRVDIEFGLIDRELASTAMLMEAALPVQGDQPE